MFKLTTNQGRRSAILVLAIGVASVLVPMGVAAAVPASAPTAYPVTSGSLTVNPSTVKPGDTVHVSGDGFAPGAHVDLELHSTPVSLGGVDADGAGEFSTTVTIPSSTSSGTHTIEATGEAATGGTRVLSAEITVQGSGGALAFTGGNTCSLVVAALGAFAVGWLLISVTRRPRPSIKSA